MYLTWTEILAVLGSYLLGSIAFGVIVAKIAGLGNLREKGSGNIGATNVARIGGKKLGFITLILDALKGLVPVLIARYYLDYEISLLCGLAAVLGHIFPVFLKFKGGKGVATSLAVLLGLYLPAGIFALVVWISVFAYSRISSLSAIMAFLLTPFFSLIAAPEAFTVLCFVLSALVIARHHANIGRLLKGVEGKIQK